MNTSELDYDLPEDLIAQMPVPRGASRLLVDGTPRIDTTFDALATFLPKGSVLVLNDTRVLSARLYGRRKNSGGRVEIFVLRVLGEGRLEAITRSSKKLVYGDEIEIESASDPTGPDPKTTVRVISAEDGITTIEFDSRIDLLGQFGRVPLPPYIRRAAEALDRTRYQTVFAKTDGAVAAPTAGLHFSQTHLNMLRSQFEIETITLHVGLGTFRPVEVNNLDDHPMHTEEFEVSSHVVETLARAIREQRSVVAVGTTVVRALETAALSGELVPTKGSTKMLIQPGYRFRVVDKLVTNFHAPRSTLLALVKAFAGGQSIDDLYAHAIRARYRFLSYGDAMLLGKIHEAT